MKLAGFCCCPVGWGAACRVPADNMQVNLRIGGL